VHDFLLVDHGNYSPIVLHRVFWREFHLTPMLRKLLVSHWRLFVFSFFLIFYSFRSRDHTIRFQSTLDSHVGRVQCDEGQ